MKKFLIGLVVVVVLIAAVGFLLPSTYAIEREVTIQATPAQVHAYVGHLEKWSEWAPWEEEDPTIVTTFGAKTTGVGASQSWTSEKEGGGELTFTKCDPQTGIAYDMAFLVEGKRAPCTSAMTYTAGQGGTTVTWTMDGDMADMSPPVVAGYMTVVMKWMLPKMFDKGLDKLKATVEAQG